MARKKISRKQLQGDLGRILGEAEQGHEFTVTVGARPVASIGPLPCGRRRGVEAATLTRILEVPIDRDDFEAELDAAGASV
jgi:antitoxin (DNA-binding transcriptional repressor) of toxin-antitoxin stability system